MNFALLNSAIRVKKKNELGEDDVLILPILESGQTEELKKPDQANQIDTSSHKVESIKAVEAPPEPSKVSPPKSVQFDTKSASTPSIKSALSSLNKKEMPIEHNSDQDSEQAGHPLDTVKGNVVSTPLKKDELSKKIKLFAEELRNSAPRIFSALDNYDPEIDVKTSMIKFGFRNSTLIDEFKQKYKPRLISFLRDELYNQNIEIDEFMVDAEHAPQAKYYTDHDKLEHMIGKNPALQKLRAEFKLDFD